MIINGMFGVEQNVRSEIVHLECIGDVQVKDEWWISCLAAVIFQPLFVCPLPSSYPYLLMSRYIYEW